ncbi:uncharacterized protein LOC143292078 [Babylonia areolata]|uniref:uncharacterized protein LOC143292078 n=1 Tax=Babylonia areolata TaxID=304850 RepID=UPI003FD5C790
MHTFLEILLVYMTAVVGVVLYLVAFGSPNWVQVEGGDFSWGLWAYCDNTTSARKRDCNLIGPGESDGYYEAARVLSAFGLVGYFIVFVSIRTCKKEDDAQLKWFIIYLVPAVLTTVALALVGAYYEDDSHWGHLDPELGYSYWLAAVAALLLVIAMVSIILTSCTDPRDSCDSSCRKKKKLLQLAPKAAPLTLRRLKQNKVVSLPSPPPSPKPPALSWEAGVAVVVVVVVVVEVSRVERKPKRRSQEAPPKWESSCEWPS